MEKNTEMYLFICIFIRPYLWIKTENWENVTLALKKRKENMFKLLVCTNTVQYSTILNVEAA